MTVLDGVLRIVSKDLFLHVEYAQRTVLCFPNGSQVKVIAFFSVEGKCDKLYALSERVFDTL